MIRVPVYKQNQINDKGKNINKRLKKLLIKVKLSNSNKQIRNASSSTISNKRKGEKKFFFNEKIKKKKSWDNSRNNHEKANKGYYYNG